MTSDFLYVVNFPWLTGDVHKLQSYGIHCDFTVDWLVVLGAALGTGFKISIQNLQITFTLLSHGYRYHKLRKTFGKIFRSCSVLLCFVMRGILCLTLTSPYSDLLSKFGEISFQECVTEGISHPVFYGDLVYKLRRVRCEANFVSSGSNTAKRLRHRKYDPLIIERTIGLVLRL